MSDILKPKWTFNSKNTALLIVDMQNDFVEKGAIMEVPDAKTQVPKIQKLISTCRTLQMPILYTVHETDPTLCPLELAAFPHLHTHGMRRGTRGAKVIDALEPQANDTVVYKRRFSAFYQTDLELIIRNLNRQNPIDTLIICGTVTNICCESTARDAFFRDFKVVFGSDICSALNAEAHNATLTNMEIFGRVLDGDGIIKNLENA